VFLYQLPDQIQFGIAKSWRQALHLVISSSSSAFSRISPDAATARFCIRCAAALSEETSRPVLSASSLSVTNGTYDLRFKVIDRVSGRPLTDRSTVLTTVNVASRPREFAVPAVTHPLDVTFDDVAKLIGADVDRSGTQMTVTLFWQGQTVTTTNYTTFVQLINSDGSITQQSDRWQIAFDSPTSTWLPGQVIADRYVFEASTEAPRFGLGLYNAATGERLPAFEQGNRLPQDRVILK